MSDQPSQTNVASPTSPQWSSRFTFLMAAMGAAVGLGNLWRFPFQTGQNGGAAFVIVYLLCVVLIAWPILSAEIAFGRAKRLSAFGSTAGLAKDAGRSARWGIIGLLGATAGFIVLTTYSAVAGQILSFSLMAFMGEFATHEPGTAFPLYDGILIKIFWFTLFLGLTVLIVARGIKDGIEILVSILMPLFFILLSGLAIYSMTTGAPSAAINYLFKPDFSAISPQMVLAALGQAFFSIAVGTAGMITYGAYLERKENITANAGIIAGADTLVALVAGLMIFPIVFTFSLDPGAGMGLIFATLPYVFADMPAGNIVGGTFFFLAFIAALTTSINMLLVATNIIKEWLGLGQVGCTIMLGAIGWVIGVTALFAHGMAETIDYLAGHILLPLGGLLVAIFAGWILPREVMRNELHNASDRTFAIWRLFIRWLCPIAVSAILIFGIAAEFFG